jgi:hypothetical protein
MHTNLHLIKSIIQTEMQRVGRKSEKAYGRADCLSGKCGRGVTGIGLQAFADSYRSEMKGADLEYAVKAVLTMRRR